MDGGLYVAVFHLRRPGVLSIGRLGRFGFPAGLYFYVGTAQRNLSSRLARHARRGKKLRWHVDYLSTRAEMLGAIVIPGPRRRECCIAAELARIMARAVPRFGAGDCRCPGHLFYAARWP
jgi:sugar fermentation stimulation protein A